MDRFIGIFISFGLLFAVLPLAAEEQRAVLSTVVIGGDGQIIFQVPAGIDGGTGEGHGFDPGFAGYGTDLLIDPKQTPFGLPNQSPYMQQGTPEQGDVLLPQRSPMLNGLSGFFSSATGGVGFRIGYDRRLSPVVRFIAGTELLTYGYEQSIARLGSAMPANVSRITLVSLPVGLQRQFAAEGRLVPHIGFGAGPILRFDHQLGPSGFYPGGVGFNAGVGSLGQGLGYSDGMDLSIGLPIDDFPQLSLTVGGFVASGMDIRLGENKDLALTVDGRYSLTYFTDMLGSPGDFSGFSLAIGFGKYF